MTAWPIIGPERCYHVPTSPVQTVCSCLEYTRAIQGGSPSRPRGPAAWTPDRRPLYHCPRSGLPR